MSKLPKDSKKMTEDPSKKESVSHNYPHLIRALKQVTESEEKEKQNAYNGVGDVTGNKFMFYGKDGEKK